VRNAVRIPASEVLRATLEESVASKEEKAGRKRLKDEYLRAQQVASAAWMPLDRGQLERLVAHVEAAVETDGCEHTLAATEAWATREDVDMERLRRGLEEYGGFCDCEVVMNVDVDEVFTPTRTTRA
jgi:hypothetical protein